MAGPNVHDKTLVEINVRDEGCTLELVLSGQSGARTQVQFSAVASYSLRHVGGAIITDLLEDTIENFKKNYNGLFESLEFLGPLPVTDTTKVWVIESAIGFWGCVIGETIDTTAI